MRVQTLDGNVPLINSTLQKFILSLQREAPRCLDEDSNLRPFDQKKKREKEKFMGVLKFEPISNQALSLEVLLLFLCFMYLLIFLFMYVFVCFRRRCTTMQL
jgi:hypothetical protein